MVTSHRSLDTLHVPIHDLCGKPSVAVGKYRSIEKLT